MRGRFDTTRRVTTRPAMVRSEAGDRGARGSAAGRLASASTLALALLLTAGPWTNGAAVAGSFETLFGGAPPQGAGMTRGARIGRDEGWDEPPATRGFEDERAGDASPEAPAFGEAIPPSPRPWRRAPAATGRSAGATTLTGIDRAEVAAPDAASPRPSPAGSTASKPAGSPITAMDDGTLEPGDAVVTARGVVVYVGEPGRPDTPVAAHVASDFVALSEADGVVGAVDRRRLAAMAATDGRGGTGTAPEGRSVAVAIPVRGEAIVDARGRVVRYVGP